MDQGLLDEADGSFTIVAQPRRSLSMAEITLFQKQEGEQNRVKNRNSSQTGQIEKIQRDSKNFDTYVAQQQKQKRSNTRQFRRQDSAYRSQNSSQYFDKSFQSLRFTEKRRPSKVPSNLAAQEITKELLFDRRLKEKMQAKDDEEQDAEKHQQFQRGVLSKIKVIVVIIYFVIVPFLWAPNWCVNNITDESKNILTIECQDVKLGQPEQPVPYSKLPKLRPFVVAIIDFTCLSYLTFYRFFKLKWRHMNKQDKARNYALVVILAISTIDHCIALDTHYNSQLGLMIRPFVVYIFFSSVRSNMWKIVQSFVDTGIIITTIFMFIGFFSLMGFFLFRNEFEGIVSLGDFGDTYYQLLILLTTANFPDIMLPAYNASYYYTIFFVIYLVLGLFLLLNILLANVFSMFKRRLEQKLEIRQSKRVKRLSQYFDKYDNGLKGYLNLHEAKRFFKLCFDLNFNKENHQKVAQSLLNKLGLKDMDGQIIVPKERLLDYFATPGFLEQINNETKDEEQDDQEPASPLPGILQLSLHSEQIAEKQAQESIAESSEESDEQQDTSRNVSQLLMSDSRNEKLANRISTIFNKDRQSEKIETVPEWKMCIIAFLMNPLYYGTLCGLNLLAIAVGLLTEAMYEPNQLLSFWRYSVLSLNVIFCIDLVLNIYFIGVKQIVKKKKYLLLECLLQLLTIIVYFFLIKPTEYYVSKGFNIAMTIYLMRLVRVLDFITEIQQFNIILSTLQKFTMPFLSMTANLYTLFYTYAFIGQWLWAGRVHVNSAQREDPAVPNLYYLMNFNDFGASMLTLFHIMIVNNWYLTCNMYKDISQNVIPQVFFISFWVLTVLIIFNLVISNVIEIYASVEDSVKVRFKKNTHAKRLVTIGLEDLQLLIQAAQANQMVNCNESSGLDLTASRAGNSQIEDNDFFSSLVPKKARTEYEQREQNHRTAAFINRQKHISLSEIVEESSTLQQPNNLLVSHARINFEPILGLNSYKKTVTAD